MKTQYNYSSFFKLMCSVAMIALLAATGCKKAVQIGPSTTLINSSNVYISNNTAEAAISGLFTKMSLTGNMYNGPGSIAVQQGLAADELHSYSTTPGGSNLFYTNTLTAATSYYWTEMSGELFVCNSAIAGLNASSALNPAIQQELLGEVKFARAYIFFNATNLFGDFPLLLSTDPNINSVIGRSPAADILKQVVQDLTDAQALLPDNSYVTLANGTGADRTLPNKQTVNALLARVYLYMKDWQDAEAQATNVINASSYRLEPVLSNVFLRTSKETIWELQSTSNNYANADAFSLVMTGPPNGAVNLFALSDSLVKAFEPGDTRFTSWVGKVVSGTTTYYYANKYKQTLVASATVITEYPIMFRLAEQYLIRAEARAQQNNTGGAQSDINAVRTRAGLANTTATTQSSLLNAVYHERRIELFTEFGHRWFDLKRTGQLDAYMTTYDPIKGGTWVSYKALIPVPQSEIVLDSHLTQNPGY